MVFFFESALVEIIISFISFWFVWQPEIFLFIFFFFDNIFDGFLVPYVLNDAWEDHRLLIFPALAP